MKHFCIAIAFIGLVASCAYCTVEESRMRKEERLFRAELCERQGGLFADGLLGAPYCDFSGRQP